MKRICIWLSVISLAAGCSGGGGGGGNASASAPVATTPPVVAVVGPLFVTDLGSRQVFVLPDVNPPVGTALSGPSFSLPDPTTGRFAYDGPNDRLFIAGIGRVFVIDHASAARGNVTPSRTIVPAGVSFAQGASVVYDKPRDTIYVGGRLASGGSAIATLVSASMQNGTIVPTRLLTYSINSIDDLTVDTTRAIAYAVTAAIGFATIRNIDTATGAQGLLVFHGIGGPGAPASASVDASRDRLYLADPYSGSVRFVPNVSTLTGDAVSMRVPIPNAADVAIDAVNDRLYVGANEKGYILNNASTLRDGILPPDGTGAVAPSGTIIGGFAFP